MTTIRGTIQNDTLYGTAGDDIIDGLDGIDRLVLTLPSSGAKFSQDTQGRWLVSSSAGRDTLTGIEQVQFSDGVVTLGTNVSDIQINTTIARDQYDSSIAALTDGGYVVTWTSWLGNGFGIYAQRYAADGSKAGVEMHIDTTKTNIVDPAVAALSDGGYVVTWTTTGPDPSTASTEIYAQRYAASGGAMGTATRVNTTTANQQFDSAIAGLSNGGYVISWTSDGQDGSSYGIYAQRYAADGSAMGGEVLINTSTLKPQFEPRVAALAGGGYVVTWTDNNYAPSGNFGIFFQRFAADGSAAGTETRINTEWANYQYQEEMAGLTALNDGGFVAAWTTIRNGNNWDIYSQRYAADGTTVGMATLVNTTTADNQLTPALAGLADGGYVITWASSTQDGSGTGVYAQRYAADGSAVNGETRINTTTLNSQYDPAVAALADGGYVITWTSQNQDGSGLGVFAQRFDASGRPDPHATLTGGSEDNVLRFSASEGVELFGGAGNDTLAGGSSRDFLTGGSGADTFEFASSGNDIDRITDFEAGDRIVIAGASFTADPTAGNGATVGKNEVQFSMENGVAMFFIGTDSTPGADVVIEIGGSWWDASQFWTSGNQISFAAPGVAVTGTSSNDNLAGGLGNDTLDGGAGKDTLSGGLRNDTYVVDNQSDVVVEKLNEGTDLVLAKVSYKLADNVENLTLTGANAINATGNALNNVIVGNDAANIITGGSGADSLTGGLGADRFVYASTAESGAVAGSWDLIVDFNGDQGDRLDLSAIDANTSAGGNQAFQFIGEAAFSANATAQVRFDSTTQMLYASTNADSNPELAIQLSGVGALRVTDIIL